MSDVNSIDAPEVHITNTYLANLQAAAARRGRPYPYLPNTTLNETLRILPNDMPQGIIPLTNCWVIGNGGTIIKDLNGMQAPTATYHDIEHLGLYGLIPFARRLKENDLSFEERAKYALREEEPANDKGEVWVNYWAKWFTEPTDEIGLRKLTITNGVIKEEAYFPQSANLRPEKPVLSPDGANEVFSEFITTTDKISCELNRTEIEEVISACRSMFGYAEVAMITEIGIVQSVPKEVSLVDHRGVPFTFREASGAQIVTHCCKANGSLLGENVFNMTFDSAVTDAMAIG